MAHAEATHAEGHQQHPLGIYLGVWLLLFVLSGFSYAVDYFQLQGLLRWSLIVLFMLLKAGFIVGIFMHMAWERLALISAILVPPLVLAGRYRGLGRGAALRRDFYRFRAAKTTGSRYSHRFNSLGFGIRSWRFAQGADY